MPDDLCPGNGAGSCLDPRCGERIPPSWEDLNNGAKCDPAPFVATAGSLGLCGPIDTPEACAPGCCKAKSVEELGQEIVDAIEKARETRTIELTDPHAMAALEAIVNDMADERGRHADEEVPHAAEVEESILQEAERIVNGPRRASYGHPAVNFARIAHLWNGYLRALEEGNNEQRVFGILLSPQDVCAMMIQLKQCRIIQTPSDRDGHVDIAGYAQCSKLIAEYDADQLLLLSRDVD